MDQEEAKRRHKKAPLLLLLRRFFAVGISFISTITIARLLGPEAYGLANMSAIILSLAQMFRDFGLTSALLRKGTVSFAERTFLFWFNTASTTGLALLLVCLAPWAAQFYNEPIIASIMMVSALSFFCSGLSLQHRSLLLREMRFGEIAWIDAIGIVVNFAVALTLALIRHDVWALVFGNLAQSLTTSTLYVWRSGFVPGRPRRFEGAAEIFKFGANTSVFSLSWFLSNNIGPILIGHFMGPATLGQYNRAQALFALPNQNLVQPIAQATLPLLTHLRSDPPAYRDAYLRLLRTLSVFLLPAAVILAFASRPLAITLLGAPWAEAGVVLGILAPTLAVMAMVYGINDLFITQDRAAELRTLGLVEVVIRVGAIAFGVMYGLVGVSAAFTLSTSAICVVRVIVSGRKGPVSAFDHVRQLLPAIPLALCCAIGCGAVSLALVYRPQIAPVELAALLGAAAISGVVSLVLFRVSRRGVLELLRTFGLPEGLKAKLSRRFPSLDLK